MLNIPKQPQAQVSQGQQQEHTEKSISDKLRISRSKIARILLLVTVLAGVGIKVARKTETRPFTVEVSEKAENDRINQKILVKGGKIATNGNAIPAKQKTKPGKIRYMTWPGQGKRLQYTEKKDGSEKDVIKIDTKKGQLFAINENCIGRIEQMRICINQKLHASPKMITGFLLNATDFRRSIKLAIERGESIQIKNYTGSPLTDGRCAFELSAGEAIAGRIPFQKNSKGHVEFLIDQDASSKKKREAIKAHMFEVAQGQIGLHDLAMECAKEAGFIGGHCGEKGNPYLYIGEENIPNEDPRKTCKRGDEHWLQNYTYLEEHPPATSHDDVHKQLNKLGIKLKINWSKEWFKKIGSKIKKGFEKAGSWTKEQCKRSIWCTKWSKKIGIHL